MFFIIVFSLIIGLITVYQYRNKPSNSLILFGILCVVAGGSLINFTESLWSLIGLPLLITGFCFGVYGISVSEIQ